MESNISNVPENNAAASGKTYSAPELQFFGFIADLTLGNGTIAHDGHGGAVNGNTGSNNNDAEDGSNNGF